jgi:hypothetical protein
MIDLISRKAVEKIIKEFFKTKVDEIPKWENLISYVIYATCI